jgi:hypothetical protein
MGRLRDPAGIEALRELRKQATVGNATFDPAVERIAVIMAAKGGLVADITSGDCIELLDCSRQAAGDGTSSRRTSPFFYQLLHATGTFPPAAPATVRMIGTQFAGSSPPSSSSTGTASPDGRSGTCSRTTCASASPASTTTPSSSWPRPLSRAS